MSRQTISESADVNLAFPLSPEVERILDAASAQFSEVGVRRSTIADVAKRAGVGRVTVYRHVGGKEQLVAAVTLRDAIRLFEEVVASTREQETLEDLIAAGFATTLLAMRAHPVWSKSIRSEPETALPRLTTDGHEVLKTAIAVTADILRHAVAAGLMADAPDLEARSEVLVRVVHSFVLTPQGLAHLESYDDLADFARAQLVCVVTHR